MKNLNYKKGFTLVESLVAITILTLAVTGAFAAAQSGISSSILSKDQVIAFYLAGEGIEQIRNIRDNNGLSHQADWLTGIRPCLNAVCAVDAVNTDPQGQPIITVCSGAGQCPVLKQDSTNGFYGYSNNPNWVPTIFNREISFTSINPNEVSIRVRVTWSKGLIQRTFDIRENILNWQ